MLYAHAMYVSSKRRIKGCGSRRIALGCLTCRVGFRETKPIVVQSSGSTVDLSNAKVKQADTEERLERIAKNRLPRQLTSAQQNLGLKVFSEAKSNDQKENTIYCQGRRCRS